MHGILTRDVAFIDCGGYLSLHVRESTYWCITRTATYPTARSGHGKRPFIGPARMTATGRQLPVVVYHVAIALNQKECARHSSDFACRSLGAHS